MTQTVTTHPGGTHLVLRDHPTMDRVGNLMYVSAWDWHRGHMTMTGGTGRGPGPMWTGGSVVAGGIAVAIVGVLPMVARRARLAAGVLSALFLLSHLPIVIGTSPEFPLLGGVERVLYASMMLVLLVTARATRLAVDGERNTSGATLGGPDTGHPADIGRVA